jgi:hypothetical protein
MKRLSYISSFLVITGMVVMVFSSFSFSNAAGDTDTTNVTFDHDSTLTITVEEATVPFGAVDFTTPVTAEGGNILGSGNVTWSIGMIAGSDFVRDGGGAGKTIPIGRLGYNFTSEVTANDNTMDKTGGATRSVYAAQAPGTQNKDIFYRLTLQSSDPAGAGFESLITFTISAD